MKADKKIEMVCLREFNDKEGIFRKKGSKIFVDSKRVKNLEKKGLAKLINDEEVSEEVVQCGASAIVEEATETGKQVEQVVNDIVKKSNEDNIED